MPIAPVLYTLSIGENVFSSFVTWVTNLVSDMFDGVSLAFCNMTMPEMTTFSTTFPFLSTAFEAIKYFALALLFLIVMFQLFKAFGGKIVEAEDPAVLIVRAMLFAVLIFCAQPIFDTVLKIAMVPYEVFDGAHGYLTESVTVGQFSALTGPNGFGAFFAVLGIFAGGSGAIIVLILSLVIFWNYLKLLLEVVERYVVLGILYYTSPLAFSLGASKSTSDVFKNWCRMVGSQLFIIVMNVWFLRGFSSALGYFIATLGGSEYGTDNNALVRMLIGYFSLLAYLRVASRFDEYLGQLGLNAAKTGGGPLGGMGAIMAMRPLARALGGSARGGLGGGLFGGKNGGGAGPASKILGTGGIGTIPNKVGAAFSPGTYVNNALGGKKQGFGGIAGAIANTAGKAYAATHGLGDVGRVSQLANSTNAALNSVGGVAGLNDAKLFMPGVFNKDGLSFSPDEQINSPGKLTGKFTDANGNTFGLVASSMSANDEPNSPFGIARGEDGTGFYVQALDKDGNVSESGMQAIFGAPTIGDSEGAIPEGDFADSFFPGQNGITDGMTFANDPDDPFTLTAMDADGNDFTLHSGAGYDLSDDAIEGMTLTDSNGQTWFAEDASPLNVDGLGIGGVVLNDGVDILDSNGNVISDDVINSIGENVGAPAIGTEDGQLPESNFADSFFPNQSDMTEGLAFSNVDGDAYSLSAEDADGNTMTFRSALEYGEGDGMVLTDANGNNWYEDTGIFGNEPKADDFSLTQPDATDPYTMTAKDDNGIETIYRNAAGYDMPEGVNADDVLTDKYGQSWFPDTSTADGVDTTNQFGADSGYEIANGNNPYEVKATDADGNTKTFGNESVYGKPEGASEEDGITDKRGNTWYPIADNSFASQKAGIEKSNQSVASFFGLNANNIQYADTSRKSDGIVTVHNKDGTSKMFVAEKGNYEVNGDSKPIKVGKQTWHEVNGSRSIVNRDTGKRNADGKPITKPVSNVRYDARVSRKKETQHHNKFAIPTRTTNNTRKKRPKK